MKIRYVVFWLIIGAVSSLAYSQEETDTTKRKLIDKIKDNNMSQKAFRSITRKPEADTVFNYKSEEAFIPYDGKIIRKIIVEAIELNRSVQDTSKFILNRITRLGESLHSATRESTIRNNIFLKEGQPLNPYRIADNERYLRDLDFIKDSRIFVIPTSEDSDSVDLLVITRDVFSIGASFNPSNATKYNFKIQEANFLGLGQRIQVRGLYEIDRTPTTGFELFTRKNSVAGSFVDVSAGYTVINTGRSAGSEDEKAYFLRFDRPLFMPFAQWAGGVEFSSNWSQNVYRKSDSLFANYKYRIQDVWGGFTSGVNKLSGEILENRNRRFVSARILNQEFVRRPTITLNEKDNLLLSDRLMMLGQLTFFRQNFYKTKYILGFGRTEDVPYGYSISLTSGFEKQFGMRRPYSAIEARKSLANRNGNFITLTGQLAGFFNDGKAEDAIMKSTVSYFSKVYETRGAKIRHFAEVGYSKYFNRAVKNPLDINNANGINGFSPDSLSGDALIRATVQALIFTNVQLLGFNFAVVPQFDLAMLSQRNQSIFSGKFFQGYSLGIRTRNENLIFNTVELRAFYYPATVEDLSHFKIQVTGNLRIKYPTALVKAPSTVFDP